MKTFILWIFFLNTVLSTNYCDLERRYCHGKKHIACDQNNFGQPTTWKDVELIPMSPRFRGEILDNFNEYRSQIALGRIKGFPKATNLEPLIWEIGFEYLMEQSVMKVAHGSFFCVATERYHRPNENSFQSTGEFTPWQFIERAFNRFIKKELKRNDKSFSSFYHWNTTLIGCAYAKYKINNQQKHTLKCLTDNLVFLTVDESYELGEPCSNCPHKGQVCDSFYAGLCVYESPSGPTGTQGPRGPDGQPSDDFFD